MDELEAGDILYWVIRRRKRRNGRLQAASCDILSHRVREVDKERGVVICDNGVGTRTVTFALRAINGGADDGLFSSWVAAATRAAQLEGRAVSIA